MATLTTIVVGRHFDAAVSTLYPIVDEHFTSSFNVWVNTANADLTGHKQIQLASVTVRTTNNVTTYTQGTDYQIDYVNGRVMVYSTGTMLDATAYHISYTYSDGSLATKINAVTTVAQAAGKAYHVYTATDGAYGVAVIVTEL